MLCVEQPAVVCQECRQTPHDDIGRACIASRGKNDGGVKGGEREGGLENEGFGVRVRFRHASLL